MSPNNELLLSEESGEGCNFTLVKARISFKWVIEKFSLLTVDGYPKISSPTFTFLSSEWRLHLYPNGRNSAHKGRVWLFLHAINLKFETKVKYKMCLKNRNARNYNVNVKDKVFNATGGKGVYLINRSLLLGEKREELLHNDILTVYCEISGQQNVTRIVTCVDDLTVTETPSTAASKEALLNDLEALLREQKNCDVSIQIGLETFHAHKCILAARSSVFAAMFQHDMAESRSSVITITDIEAAVMSDVLQYIYSGRMKDNSAAKALDLYVAADKYDLRALKSQCADVLRRSLRVDNFFEIAVLADAYNDRMIINCIKRFVGDNSSFLSGENCTRFVKKCPDLASEVLQVLSQKRSTEPNSSPQSKKPKLVLTN